MRAVPGRLGGVLEGTLRAVRTVKVNRAEDRMEGRIMTDARAAARYGTRAVRREAPAWTTAWSGTHLAVIATLSVGVWRVGEGRLKGSVLIAFLLYAFPPPVDRRLRGYHRAFVERSP
nr:hypothetical protein [Streptomyces antimycoticus]